MKTVLLVLCVLLVLFFAFPGEAQYPRPPHRPISSYDIARHLTTTRFTRIVVVDSSGGGDYKKLSDALAYIAAKDSSQRNWTSRWTVLVYPGQQGSTAPAAVGFNYTETTLTIPAYTEVLGFPTGRNDPISWTGGTPVIELRATSGTLIKLGGGSALTNLQFFWMQTPTAAVTALDHTTVPDNDPVNHNVSSLGELTNVSFNLLGINASFPVDGITESSGGLLVHDGGVLISGSTAGRTVVNAGSNAYQGLSLYGGRYAGAGGCAALIANAGASALKLFAGVRIDAGCANDLVRTGAGAIEVHGGITYGPASGTITHGTVHLPFGTSNPATCSPGAAFVNTTSGAEKICACTATNTWRCAPLS